MPHELSHTVQQGGTANRDALTSDHKATFGGGYQQKTLKSGTVLYRLCSQTYRTTISDFWIDQDTFVTLIRKVQMAEATFCQGSSNTRKRNMIKNELALLDNWGNALTHRQKIVLKQEVIAYVGPIKSQSHYIDVVKNGRKEKLPFSQQTAGKLKKQVEFRTGGQTQYVIPRFASKFREPVSENPLFEGKVFKLFKSPKYKPF